MTIPEHTRHIVALSGGKDSTAMALRLMEAEPRDYTFVCTPTGNEPDAMFEHWRTIGEMLGKPILPIMGGTLHGLIREQKRLPNHRQRWCTRRLKLEPYYKWLATQTPCVSHVGLRADEEGRPGMIFPDADGVQMDFPMRRWGWQEKDVWDYLASKGVTIPKRTDCKDCFWATLGELYELWRDDLPGYLEGEQLEEYVSAEKGESYTFRSPQRDTWPASRRALRARFEAGDVPTISLARMDKKRRETGACRVCTL